MRPALILMLNIESCRMQDIPTYDDGGVGVEVVMVVGASQLADVDVHSTIVVPVISAGRG